MKPKNKTNTKKEIIVNTEAGPCAILYTGLNSRSLDPLSRYLPECLLPVGNVPVLHFVISHLISDGFKRIIIYACRGSKLIEDFVAYHYPEYQEIIEICHGHYSKCIGDIMRDLDSSEVIRNVDEFIFMPADLLCSSNLKTMLEKFSLHRESAPNCVMAIALSNFSKEASLNSDSVQAVFIRESDNKLIQYHQNVSHLPNKPIKDTLIHQNLSHIGLWICSKHIPPLFQDNFDYTSSEDLIHGILINEEVINYQIIINFLDREQLHFRMASDLTRLFDSNRLLLRRKTGTIFKAPTSYLQGGSVKLKPGCDYIYIDDSAKVSTTARLLGHCFIAKDCVVGSESILIDTVLGPGTCIGSNCQLRSVICTNNVIINNKVIADQAFICAGARILDNTCLGTKTFLGPSSVLSDENRNASDEDKIFLWEQSSISLCIGPNVSIPSRSVFLCPDKNDEVLSSKIIGENGWAILYKPPKSCDSDYESSDSDNESLQKQKLTLDEVNPQLEDIWTSCIDRERNFRLLQSSGRLSRYNSFSRDDLAASSRQRSSISVTKMNCSIGDVMPENPSCEDDSLEKTDAERSEDVIIDELKCTMERSIQEKVLPENSILDINSLKHAYAQKIEDMYFLIAKALLLLTKEMLPEDQRETNSKLFATQFSKIIDTLKPVLDHYYLQSEEGQEILLESLEDSACYSIVVRQSMLRILKHLYDVDLLEENIILKWEQESNLLDDEDLGETANEIRTLISPFITWLKEAESDSED